MHRVITYAGQIPLETDILETNLFAMVGLGRLAAAVLGSNTLLNGLACSPTSSGSLAVQIGAGEIYSMQAVDNTAYSSLGSDTTHQVLKQGLLEAAAILALSAPTTSGTSINYLIQGGYSDVDADPVVLPYYNASNTSQAFAGPNNNGVAQPTHRKSVLSISVVAGAAAATGTQTTPAPQPGNVPMYVVTVANGQTAIVSGNIAVAAGAPFITETLTQKISQATADGRYAQSSALPGAASETTAGIARFANASELALLANKGLMVSPGELATLLATVSQFGLVQLAAGTDVLAGTNASLAATPASLAAGAMLGTNGYKKLPGGLILQWGKLSSVSGTQTVTFPITFPTAFLHGNYIGTFTDTTADSVNSINNPTTSGMVIHDTVGTEDMYWFAIGY